MKISKAIQNLQSRGIERPTAKQIRKESGITSEVVFNHAFTIREISMMLELDKPVENNDYTLADILDSKEDLEAKVINDILLDQVHSKFQQLSEEGRFLIGHRYGVFGMTHFTNCQICNALGISEPTMRERLSSYTMQLEDAPMAA